MPNTPKWPRDHHAKHVAAAKKGWQRRRSGSRPSEPTRYFGALEAAPARVRSHSPKRHVATRKRRVAVPRRERAVTAGRVVRAQAAVVRGKRRGIWRGIDAAVNGLRS